VAFRSDYRLLPRSSVPFDELHPFDGILHTGICAFAHTRTAQFSHEIAFGDRAKVCVANYSIESNVSSKAPEVICLFGRRDNEWVLLDTRCIAIASREVYEFQTQYFLNDYFSALGVVCDHQIDSFDFFGDICQPPPFVPEPVPEPPARDGERMLLLNLLVRGFWGERPARLPAVLLGPL
jgi:hypothetical protein